MEVLLHGGPQLNGWRSLQIWEAILQAFALSPETYTLNQLRYDLRKIQSHGLLERVGKHYAYRLTRALEDLVDGEITLEDKIETVLDLIERVVAAQVDGGPVFLGELGPQHPGPGIGIIVLAEADALALEFTGDEVMTVDPVAGLEGEEGSDAQDHGVERTWSRR
jgi:hypothetical protein